MIGIDQAGSRQRLGRGDIAWRDPKADGYCRQRVAGLCIVKEGDVGAGQSGQGSGQYGRQLRVRGIGHQSDRSSRGVYRSKAGGRGGASGEHCIGRVEGTCNGRDGGIIERRLDDRRHGGAVNARTSQYGNHNGDGHQSHRAPGVRPSNVVSGSAAHAR